ncbi:MAG: GNAT family N-acetyltransferase [Lachnospiraceae bacterium]|nr:GNAT family N-acetyltransferase [Lachnospiraceae bacterium]
MESSFIREGKYCRLRPMTAADCADVIRWRNKDRVRLEYIYMEKLSLEEEEAYYRNRVEAGKVWHFIICDKAHGDRGVGCQVFNDVDVFLKDPENTMLEVGYFIGEEDALGTGIAIEGMRLGMHYAFETYGAKIICSRIFTDNGRSIRACEKVGMRVTDTIPDVLRSDGTRKEMKLLTITRQELEEAEKRDV